MSFPSLRPISPATIRPFTQPSLPPGQRRSVRGSPRHGRMGLVLALAGLAMLPSSAVASRPTRVSGQALPRRTSTGAEVRWRASRITLTIDPSLQMIAPEAATVVGEAITRWADAGAGIPELTVDSGPGVVAIDRKNAVIFARDGAPEARGALAFTAVSYDEATGEILDADIIINGGHAAFAMLDGPSTRSTDDRYDAQSILTHELGHVLGLGEDYGDATTTMSPHTKAGTISKRELTDHDVAAIRGLYQEEPEAKKGCSVDARPRAGSSWLAVVCLGVVAAIWGKRSSREWRA